MESELIPEDPWRKFQYILSNCLASQDGVLWYPTAADVIVY